MNHTIFFFYYIIKGRAFYKSHFKIIKMSIIKNQTISRAQDSCTILSDDKKS